MAKITIDREFCKGCLLCVTVCPRKAVRVAQDLNARGVRPAEFIDNSECIGCAMCALVCPDCCIEVYK